jgi:hypothetical protein
LLSQPPVQQELDLMPQQLDLIAQLSDTLPPPVPPGQQKSAARTNSTKLVQEADAAEATLDKILSETQTVRLRQISLQEDGPRAFDDSDVIEALGLTNEQAEGIRRIRASFGGGPPRGPMGRPMPGGPGGPGGPDGPGGPGGPRDRDGEIMKQILAELSASQMQTWSRLIGPPFYGRVMMFRGPGGGPPPG